MMIISSAEDILAIKESFEVEFKKATGKDGVGKGSKYRLATGGVTNSTGGVTNSTGGVTNSNEEHRYYKVEDIPHNIYEKITKITEPLNEKKRVKKEFMQDIILNICTFGYFSIELLSIILYRNKDTIKEYVLDLASKKKLKPYFPSSNSPKQAYTTRIGNAV